MGLMGSPGLGTLEPQAIWGVGQDGDDVGLLAHSVGSALGAQEIIGTTVFWDLGVGRAIQVRSKVGAARQLGSLPIQRVALYHWVSGGPFGEDEILFATCGYGTTAADAVASGGAEWGHLVEPILRAAAGLDPGPAVTHRERTTVGQHTYQMVCHGADWGCGSGQDERSWAQTFADLRLEIAPGQWMSPMVVASHTLPPLTAGRLTVLAITVTDTPAARTVEIAVNGRDWPSATAALRRIPGPAPALRTVILREVAVLVPL